MEECYDVTVQSVQVCELTLLSTSEMNEFHKIWYKSHTTEGHYYVSVLTLIQPVKNNEVDAQIREIWVKAMPLNAGCRNDVQQ